VNPSQSAQIGAQQPAHRHSKNGARAGASPATDCSRLLERLMPSGTRRRRRSSSAEQTVDRSRGAWVVSRASKRFRQLSAATVSLTVPPARPLQLGLFLHPHVMSQDTRTPSTSKSIHDSLLQSGPSHTVLQHYWGAVASKWWARRIIKAAYMQNPSPPSPRARARAHRDGQQKGG
jgi:hypothetical protein